MRGGRTRPSRRGSSSTRLPPSANRRVKRLHAGLTARAPYGARIAALGHAAVRAGDHDAAAHAEVNAEFRAAARRTAGGARLTQRGGLQPDRLALPVRGGEAAAGQGAAPLARCVRAPDVAVGIVHIHDAPLQGLVSDQAAGRLNLGKLGHLPVLPSRPRRPVLRGGRARRRRAGGHDPAATAAGRAARAPSHGVGDEAAVVRVGIEGLADRREGPLRAGVRSHTLQPGPIGMSADGLAQVEPVLDRRAAARAGGRSPGRWRRSCPASRSPRNGGRRSGPPTGNCGRQASRPAGSGSHPGARTPRRHSKAGMSRQPGRSGSWSPTGAWKYCPPGPPARR